MVSITSAAVGRRVSDHGRGHWRRAPGHRPTSARDYARPEVLSVRIPKPPPSSCTRTALGLLCLHLPRRRPQGRLGLDDHGGWWTSDAADCRATSALGARRSHWGCRRLRESSERARNRRLEGRLRRGMTSSAVRVVSISESSLARAPYRVGLAGEHGGGGRTSRPRRGGRPGAPWSRSSTAPRRTHADAAL